MAPKEPKISKQTAAGTTRHITFAFSETLEIITKPGSATFQSVIWQHMRLDFWPFVV